MPPIHGSFPWCFFRPFRQARHSWSWSWLAGEQTYVACLCAISTPSVSQIPPMEPYVRTSSIPALTRNRKLDQTCLRAGRPKAVHKRPPPCMPNLLDQGGRHLFDRSSTQSVRNRAFLPSWLVGIVLYPQLQSRIKMSKKSGGSKTRHQFFGEPSRCTIYMRQIIDDGAIDGFLRRLGLMHDYLENVQR